MFGTPQRFQPLLSVLWNCLRTAVWVSVGVALQVPKPTTAQEIRVVRDSPACDSCRLTLEHLVTFGEREGPGRVMKPTAMARDSRGNYLIAHGDGGGHARQVWVFDPDGAFVQTLGREGDGPGEYRSIRRIDVLPGDTLELFDVRLRRRTTLSPDHTFLASQSYEAAGFPGSARLPDGRLVLRQHIRTPERVGYPFQLVDRSGKIVRSLGSLNPQHRPKEEVKYMRSVASSPKGSLFWTIGYGDYLMELWDTTGARLDALQRETKWFEPYVSELWPITPDGPTPQSQVRIVKVDSENRIWTLVRKAKEDWRMILRSLPGGHEEDASLIQNVYDWVLEIVDPDTGELLVSQVLEDREYVRFLDEDLIVSYREDSVGFPFLDIWRIKFVSPQAFSLLDRSSR